MPPRYGGPLRVYNLCLQLSRAHQVWQFAQQIQRSRLRWSLAACVQSVNANYVEWSSRDPASLTLYALTSLRLSSPPIWQSVILRISRPRWLREKLEGSDLVIVEQPWQFEWIYQQVNGTKPVVLGSQNCEANLYSQDQMRCPAWVARKIRKEVERQESFAVRHASHILAACDDDVDSLVTRYGVDESRFTVIPNGVDCRLLKPVDEIVRQTRKRELGLAGRTVAVFAGSLHGPNIAAVNQILIWAESAEADNLHYLVVGTIGRAFSGRTHPRVTFTGSVADTRPYLEAAEIGLNPVLSGSGTNLKQLELMAMGLPVVASQVGVRGLQVEDGRHCLVREPEGYKAAISHLAQCYDDRQVIGANARTYVASQHDWRNIGRRLINAIDGL